MVNKNIILDDWQRSLLEHNGNLLLCTGRQVGKTTIFSRKIAKYLLENPNCQIIVVSLTEDQAKLMIIMVLDYLEKVTTKKIKKNQKFTNQNKITLTNGSRVIARPVGNTGDAIRGFTGDVLVIDEASRMSELIFEASKPTLLTTGGQIWMCSTPFGKRGYFYECWLNKYNRFKVFHISSEEVIKNRPVRAGWTEETKKLALLHLEAEKRDMSELQYGQEYLGLFLDDLRRFYEDVWIEKVCSLKRDPNIPSPKIDNYLGCDIARMGGDKTTYEILHAPKDERNTTRTTIRQIFHALEDHKPTTHTEQRIIDISRQFNISKIGIDAGSGSLGVGVFDHLLLHPETKKKVVAMNNRQISLDKDGKKKQRIMNEDYHELLKAGGEHGEVLLFDDDEIKNSFRSIQIEIVRKDDQVTDVKIHGKDSHIVEGIKRAYWLAKKEKIKRIEILSF
jgi:hypothetical protein